VNGEAPSGRLRGAQERALARYLRRHVVPYSPFYRNGLVRPEPGPDGFARLPFARLEDVRDPGDLVLRPTAEGIASSGDLALIARLSWARLWRRVDAFNRRSLEPVYKTVHWHREGDVPIGYSAEDLERLAEVGRVSLEMAGLGRYDVLVSVVPPGPHLAFWQLALGTRRGGLSAMLLPAATGAGEVVRLAPSALAGRPGDLVRLLTSAAEQGLALPNLHTVLVAGVPLDAMTRDRLASLAALWGRRPAVVAWWAPPGARALWSECRDGEGLHTWPGFELIELIDPRSGTPVAPGGEGEIVWTPIGWKGSILLRLRSGTHGSLDVEPCPSCGRRSPRVRPLPGLPLFARVLEEHPGVAAWQAEVRAVGATQELILFLAPARPGHPGPLLRELDRELSVTQFVVLNPVELEARQAAYDGARVIDLRR
jgi:hypothetical protein